MEQPCDTSHPDQTRDISHKEQIHDTSHEEHDSNNRQKSEHKELTYAEVVCSNTTKQRRQIDEPSKLLN